MNHTEHGSFSNYVQRAEMESPTPEIWQRFHQSSPEVRLSDSRARCGGRNSVNWTMWCVAGAVRSRVRTSVCATLPSPLFFLRLPINYFAGLINACHRIMTSWMLRWWWEGGGVDTDDETQVKYYRLDYSLFTAIKI